MGITNQEFQVAMETYGAKRLTNYFGDDYGTSVECFDVEGIVFVYSGTNYVITENKQVLEKIIINVMPEFGETTSSGESLWWSEMHSIRGMLTLVAMIEGKYSKEYVNELTNAAYKKLLDCEFIKSNIELPPHSLQSPKMEQLDKLLTEFSNVVNPFGNSDFKIKEPIQYLGTIKVSMEYSETITSLILTSNASETVFVEDITGWLYDSSVAIQRNRSNGYINIGNYYCNGSDGKGIDEIIYLTYKEDENSYESSPNDIDLRISLKTGMAWKGSFEDNAKPVTDEQIDTMIAYLKITIKKLRKKIMGYIVEL